MGDLLADATAKDLLWISLVATGAGFLPIYALCWMFEFFIGLKSPPTKRAALTVGLAYVLTSLAFIWLSPANYALLAAMAPMPGAIVWFFYTRSHYRKAWYDNLDELPEEAALANDNWRHGLLYLALAILAIVGVVLARVIKNGIVGSL